MGLPPGMYGSGDSSDRWVIVGLVVLAAVLLSLLFCGGC